MIIYPIFLSENSLKTCAGHHYTLTLGFKHLKYIQYINKISGKIFGEMSGLKSRKMSIKMSDTSTSITQWYDVDTPGISRASRTKSFSSGSSTASPVFRSPLQYIGTPKSESPDSFTDETSETGNFSPQSRKSVAIVDSPRKDVYYGMYWSTPFHYYCVVGCMVIGLGNLVYFPMQIKKHGAISFLVLYGIFLFIFGYPLLLLQMGIAQFTSQGPGGCWEFAILFKGIGYAIIFIVFYQGKGFIELATISSVLEYRYISNNYNISNANNLPLTSGFHALEQHLESGIPDDIKYSLIITLVLVCLHAMPNIQLRGKISSTIFLSNIITIGALTIKSLTLSGAWTGIKVAFQDTSFDPMNIELWSDAFTQCMYSLALVPGYHMTTASFNHFNNLIPYETLVIMLVDTCMSLVGILLTFSLLGHLSVTTDFKLEDIETIPGDRIFFVLLPYSLESEEIGKFWVCVYFFIRMVFHHLHSVIALVVITRGLIDIFKLRNRHQTICVATCVISFLMTALHYSHFLDLDIFHQMYEDVTPAALLMVYCFVISWVYGVDELLACIECSVGWDTTTILSNHYWKMWWKLSWKFICPFTLLIYVITHMTKYGPRSEFYWVFWLIIILLVFSPMVYMIITTHEGGLQERVLYLTRPSQSWGPKLPHHQHIMRVGAEDVLRAKRHDKKNKPIVATTYEELSLMM